MLKSATFTNFTSVPSEQWEFSPTLNIIVGENGLGKSHILKAIYSVIKSLDISPDTHRNEAGGPLLRSNLERRIAKELIENMRPDSLGRLVKRKQGRSRAEVKLSFRAKEMNTTFSFASNSKTQVDLSNTPSQPAPKSPVFFPTRELITLSPWFLSLYDNYSVPFEKSWRDTVSLLGAPSVRGPRERRAKSILGPIEAAIGGKVEVDKNGRFFLHVNGGRMEAALVAEGLRKFAMLARLVSTGTLLEQGYLFWDEPETNLNPRLIRILASTINEIADQGIQVFIATHSLFLLREIEILKENGRRKGDARFFALAASGDDEVSHLEQGRAISELDTLVLLDEELNQTDRFFETQSNG